MKPLFLRMNRLFGKEKNIRQKNRSKLFSRESRKWKKHKC